LRNLGGLGILLGMHHLLLGCAGSLGSSPQSSNQGPKSPIAKRALDSSWKVLKEGLPMELLADYGFESPEQLQRVTFGEPIPVQWFRDTVLEPVKQWQIPVQDSGQALAWMQMDSVDGTWQSNQLSGALLARRWQALCAEQVSCEDSRLVRIPALQSDFMSLPGDQPLIPLNPNQSPMTYQQIQDRIRSLKMP
jgi:hypothetical protein